MIALGRIKSNPKYSYKYAKSKSKVRTAVGPLDVNGEIMSKPSELFERLNLIRFSVLL